MKHNQKGFGAIETILIVVIVGIIGGLGWYVWNRQQKDTKNNSPSTTQSESPESKTPEPETAKVKDPVEEFKLIKKAITDQSKACPTGTADFTSTPATLKVVSADAAFDANVNATITSDYDFAYVAFGCKNGSQAEVSVLKKANDSWTLLAEDASYIMPCSKVDKKNIPKAIISQECYSNEAAGTDQRPIQN